MEVDGNEGKDGQNSSSPFLVWMGVCCASDSLALLAGNDREKFRRSQQTTGQQRYKGFLAISEML